MAHRAYLSLGSNLDRERNFADAIERIGARRRILRESRRLDTPAVGCPGAADFLNSVIEIETNDSPEELFRFCRGIEATLGRTRGSDKNAPRPIDIDILLYDDLTVTHRDFQIPYPGMEKYGFVMTPLAELIPDTIHPTLGKTIRDLAAALPPLCDKL